MPSTLIVGGVGAGKTYNAVAVIAKNKDKGFDNIYANMELNVPTKILQKWNDPNNLQKASCGYLLIDEADMWFNSRNYANLNDTFRNLLKEHRKHHLRIISTTQHLSFVDKIMRIFIDDVWLVKKFSIPFLGWFDKNSIRPDIICKHCGKLRVDDGRGDRHKWYHRYFGFGTFYMWKIYPPTILRDEEDMKSIDEMDIPSRGWGWCRFNLEIAQMYDTSSKVSETAHEYKMQKKAPKSFWGSKR